MTLAKSILTFIVSSIFILFLYLTINSYTLGNTIQKDNFENFLSSQIAGSFADSNCQDMCESQINSSCLNSCGYIQSELQPYCIESCKNDTQVMHMCIQDCLNKINQSQSKISDLIDGVYNKQIISGVTVNDIARIFSNNLLLLAVTILSAVSLFFVAEKPVSKLGGNIMWVSLSILLVALVPIVIVKPEDSVLKMISDYLFASLYQQAIIGAVLLAVGIALLLVGRKIKK